MRKNNKAMLFARTVAFWSSLVLALLPLTVLAQGKPDQGEIEQVEIQITKDRKIKLPPADRNFEKVPPRPAEPIKPAIVYQFRSLPFSAPDYSPVIRPLKLKDAPISKIYGNYVSAGLGNYTSPYLEAYLANKRDADKNYGVKFFHRSFLNGPVDNGNSGSGTTQLRLFGKSMNQFVALSGYAEYENRTTHFYGYPAGQSVDQSAIRQSFNLFNAGMTIENARLSDFKYTLKADYGYLSDHYAATEHQLDLAFAGRYTLDAQRAIDIQADYAVMNRKDAAISANTRHLLRIRPAFRFAPTKEISVSAGFNAAIENDTIGSQKGVHLYPNFSAVYTPGSVVQVYASLSGDVDRVSLHTLVNENLWLGPNVGVFNTNRKLEFTGGLTAKVAGKVSMGAGVSFATLKNLYSFQLDTGKSAGKFFAVYDNGTTQRTNLFGEVNYLSEKFRIGFRGDYFGYSSDIVNQIADSGWERTSLNRPTYRVAISSSANIYEKILLDVAFIAQGGLKAYDLKAKQLTELPAAMDMNVKLNYRVSKPFSVFLHFNNAFSSQYQLYLNYPVRGFQVLGGASWSF